MKSTVQQDGVDTYDIIYAAAPWIELGRSVGLFTNIQMGQNDMFTSEFTRGTDGTDFLTVFISPGEDPTPVSHQVHNFPIEAGLDQAGVSTQVLLRIVNNLTGEELVAPRTLPYGKDAYHPKPRPQELYMLTYLSGPYARFSGRRSSDDEVFIIVNMPIRSEDQVEAVFTVGEAEADYDNFELRVTTEDLGDTVMFCKVFGPYQLSNENTVTAMATTSANGKPVQKPVGIKSYGNDSWFF